VPNNGAAGAGGTLGYLEWRPTCVNRKRLLRNNLTPALNDRRRRPATIQTLPCLVPESRCTIGFPLNHCGVLLASFRYLTSRSDVTPPGRRL